MSRIRALLAGACLVLLAVCELRARRPLTVAGDARELARTSLADPDGARAGGIGFAFDPAYEAFLGAVRDRTPQRAVIVFAPPNRHELYTYQAWYVLAPRRVVPPERTGEGDYLASYRTPAGRGNPVPGGRLERLR